MADDLEEEYEDEAEGEESSGGGKRKKLLLLVILVVLVVVGGLAAAYFTGLADPLLKGGAEAEHQAAPAAEGDHAAGSQVQAAIFYDLPEMLVDLNTQGRKRTFLKIRVSLELSSPSDTAVIESVMPRIIDNFQVYLRELRLEDLQGAAGIYRLREELLVRVNQAVRPAKVNDVLFKDMLIQ
jgi:flagellar FliL protein